MRSICWLVVAGAVAGLVGPERSARAAADARVDLGISARNQAPQAPAAGWCGETAIQESLLYYGAFVPQRHINRAGRPRHPDLYWGDIPIALKRLGLRYRRWSRGNLPAFLRWIRRQLDSGRPIVAGVKINPTEHPRWGLDHMVLVVGYDERGLIINTTWGRRVHRTYAELASTTRGFSFANRYRRYHAFVIDGHNRAGTIPLRLTVRTETASRVQAFAVASTLRIGKRYALEQYDARSRRWRRLHRFTATAKVFRRSVGIPKGSPMFLRVSQLD